MEDFLSQFVLMFGFDSLSKLCIEQLCPLHTYIGLKAEDWSGKRKLRRFRRDRAHNYSNLF